MCNGSDVYPNYYLRCFAGYQNSLSDAGYPIYPGWISNRIYNKDLAFDFMKKTMTMAVKPTAICCMSDMCAIHAIQAAAMSGIRIPEDLSLVSIDDIMLSRYVYPSLTTISYNKNEIGKTAANLLLAKIAGNEPESILIKCDGIVERQSVADIKAELTIIGRRLE